MKIFVRLGASDVVIEKSDYDKDPNMQPEDTSFYFIGYEDEEGNECTEDGVPLEKK